MNASILEYSNRVTRPPVDTGDHGVTPEVTLTTVDAEFSLGPRDRSERLTPNGAISILPRSLHRAQLAFPPVRKEERSIA